MNSTMTDSVKIAKVFKKKHTDIIKKIEKLEEFDRLFDASKIELSEYKDKNSKAHKMYLLDRDVMAFVIMGLTGEVADAWKWDFISLFNCMKSEID